MADVLVQRMAAERISRRVVRLLPPDSVFLPAKLFPQTHFQPEGPLGPYTGSVRADTKQECLAKAHEAQAAFNEESRCDSSFNVLEWTNEDDIWTLKFYLWLPPAELPGLRFVHADPASYRRMRRAEVLLVVSEYVWQDNLTSLADGR